MRKLKNKELVQKTIEDFKACEKTRLILFFQDFAKTCFRAPGRFDSQEARSR